MYFGNIFNLGFLANGDFGFPFEAWIYFLKTFYLWSSQNGAINLDGVFRLPIRLFLLIFYPILGNLGVSYLYLFLALVIAACSAYFALSFFKKIDIHTRFLLSLFYVINPIFLANISKIGLILGASMLPFVIILLKKYIQTKSPRYFILAYFGLIVSLIHPFTFIVNTFIATIFFVTRLYSNPFRKELIISAIKALVICGMLSAFLILSIYSTQALNKASIVSTINANSSNTDSFIGFANSGSLVNTFTWSRDVLTDYDYYNSGYKIIFVIFGFSFQILLIIAFFYSNNKNIEGFFSRLFLGILLLLYWLALNNFGSNIILSILNNLPGGWAFRSPLKWQLYIPILAVIILGLGISRMSRTLKFISLSFLTIIIFGWCGFMLTEIYNKLLIPKLPDTDLVQSLNNIPNHSMVIWVDGGICNELDQIKFFTLNQHFLSKDIEVKHISEDNIQDALSLLNSAGYVITCISTPVSENQINALTKDSNWTRVNNMYLDPNLFIFKNIRSIRNIFTFDYLYSFESKNNLDEKYNFVNNQLHNGFYFYLFNKANATSSATYVDQLFENVNFQNISTASSSITATTTIYSANKNILYALNNFDKLSIDNEPIYSSTTLLNGIDNQFTYTNKNYTFKNLITNGSFERGFWQQAVGDCHNYDQKPILGMKLDAHNKTDGVQSLQLEATRHTACISIELPINATSTYLLSFDYQSSNAKSASYYIGFNDPVKTSDSENLPLTDTAWHTLTRTIKVPAGATTLSLYVYAKETDVKTNNINRYDNFKLVEIPDISSSYYLVSEPDAQLVQPASTTFDLISPTKKLVYIRGATTPFFLGMSESYHDKWYLELNNAKVQGRLDSWWPFAKPDRVGDEYHYKLNGFLNGWYVDTTELCEVQKLAGCTQNPGGSYDIEMVIEFWPQRWFYLGLIVSGLTLAGCLGYLGYAGVGHVRRKYRSRAH